MGTSIAEGGLDDDEEFAEAHEINVTPFIDVMLVLLIIFMVAAPLSTVDFPVDLPTTTTTPQQKKPDKPVYVSIRPDLTLAIDETPVKRADLLSALDAEAERNPDHKVTIRADRSALFGDVFDVMELLRKGHYKMAIQAKEGVPEIGAQSPAQETAKPEAAKP
jgi:biopolymer transport protein ExbD